MKSSGTCTKCRSRDLLRVPGQVGAHGAGNNIVTGRTVFSAIPVTRYLCASCGFSEEWVDDPENLRKVKDKFGD